MPGKRAQTRRATRGRLPERLAIALLALAACLVSERASPAGGVPSGLHLCVAPVEMPIGVRKDDPRLAKLDRMLAQALEADSFTVTGSEDVGRTIDALRKTGGESWEIHDPLTGGLDERRAGALRARLGSALRDAYGCEARVVPSVAIVAAPFKGQDAEWDGAGEAVVTSDRVSMNDFEGVLSGWVPATSLWITVYDVDGKVIAFRSGGIETLVQWGVENSRDFLPEDAWLTHDRRITRAIQAALGLGGVALIHDATP